MFRYNSSTGEFEGYTSAWGSIGGGASAGGVIYENAVTISSDYTLSTNKNGMSVGPVTIRYRSYCYYSFWTTMGGIIIWLQ